MSENIDEIDVEEYVDEEGLRLFLDNLKLMFIPMVAGADQALTDLDSANQSGLYRYAGTAEHRPTNAAGTVFVIRTSGAYIYQIAFANNSAGNITIYIRMKTSNGWGNWSKLAI